MNFIYLQVSRERIATGTTKRNYGDIIDLMSFTIQSSSAAVRQFCVINTVNLKFLAFHRRTHTLTCICNVFFIRWHHIWGQLHIDAPMRTHSLPWSLHVIAKAGENCSLKKLETDYMHYIQSHVLMYVQCWMNNELWRYVDSILFCYFNTCNFVSLCFWCLLLLFPFNIFHLFLCPLRCRLIFHFVSNRFNAIHTIPWNERQKLLRENSLVRWIKILMPEI